VPTVIEQSSLATQLREAQAQVARLTHQLEHTQRLATLGTICAGIAHEINNILTPVLAYSQLAASNPSDAALQKKAIEKAMYGVETATQITQAMLGFSGNPSQSGSANLRDVVDAALDTIGRDPAKDRIKIVLKIDPQIEVSMRPLALQQVLVNIILNACTAMKRSGGELTISAISRGDGLTVIRLADTGPGIAPDIAGRIFEPFISSCSPADRSANDKRQGTGLGLAICRQLIESADGTIIASTKLGEGTTFIITLPTLVMKHQKAG
jgi:signal transduction histidine kinase